MGRRFTASLAGPAAAVLVLGALAVPAAALAEAGDPAAPVTWSVSPAGETGADGRAWVELELDPGATVTEHLVVRNLGADAVEFALAAADGYFTHTGRFTMLPSDEPSVDAGTWIEIQDSVHVPAGGSAVVPFTVAVPDDVTPGDHAAGVAASITTVSSGDGAKVGVESRVGFRVMTRVRGEISPGLALTGDGSYRMTWNPLAPGSVEISAELENTGNVRLEVAPSVVWNSEVVGPVGVAEGQRVELLPGDRRTLTIRVPAVWPVVAIGLPLRVDAAAIELDGSSTAIDPVRQEVTVWALPVPQFAVLIALTLVVAGILLGRRRRTVRVERMLVDAREAGRREALGGGSDA